MKKKIYIGGEYYYKPTILFKKSKFNLNNYLQKKYPNKEFTFTGGGYYSLYRIIDDIDFMDDEEILFPSYLCPTILTPFKKRNIKYKFFQVNKNLEIDIQELKSKINRKTRAVFFINFFGFPPDEQAIEYLFSLKKSGIVLIEDCVQSFFSEINLIGDYAFNSFRKFLPLDGSVIISEHKLNTNTINLRFSMYFFYKGIGKFLRMLNIHFPIIDTSSLFLRLFKLAEDNYYKHEYVNFDFWNKYILSKLDINFMSECREKNFNKMLHEFKELAIINRIKENIIPLGFPILVGNRDEFRKVLISRKIFCPIHWKLPKEINRDEFPDSWNLSENILTIPISENITSIGINYMLDNLLKRVLI